MGMTTQGYNKRILQFLNSETFTATIYPAFYTLKELEKWL